MKRFLCAAVAAAVMSFPAAAFASGAIPDHQGTSMEGIEIGTKPLGNAVKKYSDLFKGAGDQYGVDPNLLAAICMQESGGVNYSYHDDGTPYPAWGIMQIEYTLENAFADFGERTTGERWTLEQRLDEEKAIPFAAWLISKSLIRYDCDYMKMIQGYNFGQTMLDKIIDAKGDDWLSERANAVQYTTNWPYETYGDAQYIEHVLRYYHNDIPYVGAKIRLNGKLMSFEDQYPLLETRDEKTYTLIPIRGISEALGADVSWNGKTRAVTIKKDGRTMILFIDSDSAVLDGEDVRLDMPAMIKNNRTMVPLRFIMEAFGVDVDWNGDTRTVIMTY